MGHVYSQFGWIGMLLNSLRKRVCMIRSAVRLRDNLLLKADRIVLQNW